MEARFTQGNVEIHQDGEVVLRGHRDELTRLWHIDLQNPPRDEPHFAANVMHIASQAQLMNFYHWTLGAPAISTMLTAINKNYLDSFPGLTATLLRKYYPNPMATSKGHLDQTRKNQRSTRLRSAPASPTTTESDEDMKDSFPSTDTPTWTLRAASQ